MPGPREHGDTGSRSDVVRLAEGRAVYRWNEPRPFFHPVTTPAGVVVTADAPDDHPWHHGLWSTIKFVNGVNFWEEYDEFGVLRHVGPPSVTEASPVVGTLSGTISWTGPDGSEVMTEDRSVTATVDGDAGHYTLDWDQTLTPSVDTVLDRTPFTTWGGYGGLTLRGRPDWHDTELLVPDGSGDGAGHQRLLGDRAPWCSIQGPVGVDDRPAGVVLCDHPGNDRFPTPWYASTRADTYGDDGWSNFVNAAFLWGAPIRLAAGAGFRRRHCAIVHDGQWSAYRCAAEYDSWLART